MSNFRNSNKAAMISLSNKESNTPTNHFTISKEGLFICHKCGRKMTKEVTKVHSC